MSMKNSHETIGNRSCDLPVCSAVPQLLRNCINATWYVSNNDLHRDLLVDVVASEIQRFAQKHEIRLHQHENAEAIQLLDNMCIVHRLQRKKPFELV
jgi:hypothetical protein